MVSRNIFSESKAVRMESQATSTINQSNRDVVIKSLEFPPNILGNLHIETEPVTARYERNNFTASAQPVNRDRGVSTFEAPARGATPFLNTLSVDSTFKMNSKPTTRQSTNLMGQTNRTHSTNRDNIQVANSTEQSVVEFRDVIQDAKDDEINSVAKFRYS